MKDCLGGLKCGVVVISGTNGKTTTTKIVTELLESEGLKVFTNKTGSNFVRGVIAALIQSVDPASRKLDADIAVLELDEAHAIRFIEHIKPTYSLLLNVMRDQLDRFAEVDYTAKLLEQVAVATADAVVINREDSRLRTICPSARVSYYGLSDELRIDLPEDDDLIVKGRRKVMLPKADVLLERLKDSRATYSVDGKSYEITLSLSGIYNASNAAGAVALVKAILPKVRLQRLFQKLSEIESAFGRGEVFEVGGKRVELYLVKNPSAFQLAIKSFSDPRYATMIAINDAPADGRDVSWLWNVDFSSLRSVDVVSGVRADGMALRLHYDNVRVGKVTTNLEDALDELTRLERQGRIFATYTSMLKIRKILTGEKLI